MTDTILFFLNIYSSGICSCCVDPAGPRLRIFCLNLPSTLTVMYTSIPKCSSILCSDYCTFVSGVSFPSSLWMLRILFVSHETTVKKELGFDPLLSILNIYPNTLVEMCWSYPVFAVLAVDQMGRWFVAGGAAVGLGALCYYGLGMSNEIGAIEKAV